MPELSEAEFQRECERIWNRSTFCHVGSFIEPLLGYDEDLRQEHDEALSEALRAEAEQEHPEEDFLDEDGDVDEYERDRTIDEWMGNNPHEPMEYYSVDGWMAARLRERHEAVFEVGNHHVWIRCATGQATYMDDCIRSIAREVLETRAGWEQESKSA